MPANRFVRAIRPFLRVTGSALCLGAAFAAAAFAAEEAPEAVTLKSTIRAVTVYADRARVTREASAGIKAGLHTYAFRALPGWVDEDSVRIALTPAGAGRIADVRIQREVLAQPNDARLREAEDKLAGLDEKWQALEDEEKVLAARVAQIEGVRAFAADKLPKDVASREVKVAEYGQVIDYVSEALREVAAARRDIARQRRALEPERAAQQRRLEDLRGLTKLEQTTVQVAVDAPAAAAATLALTTILPGAAWEPLHELRAEGAAPGRVSVSSYAVVSQTTGEDWSGAALSFSTQSSADTIRIPELDALLLGGRPSPRLAMQASSSFMKAKSAFEDQNRFWFNYANDRQQDLFDAFVGNGKRQEEMQRRSEVVFNRMRERGTTAQFAGEDLPTVRSDGSPVRVRIGEREFAATSRIVAVPQQSLNAVHTLRLVNGDEQPLLPGKVALFHGGAFVGTTEVDFVAKGETFPVFLGVADQLKISRVMDPQRSSINRGRKTRIAAAFLITVENLSRETAEFQLTDRVPVSENRDVSVERVRTTPKIEPDTHGLVRWDLKLGPGEKVVCQIEYTVEYPPEVVARTRRPMQMQLSDGYEQAAASDAAPVMPPAPPSPDASVDLLRELESKF